MNYITISTKTFVLVSLLFCLACGNKKEATKEITKPTHLLTKPMIIDIIVDLHLLEAANAQRLILDSITSVNQPAYQEGVFKKHHTTRANFNASYNYFTTNNDTAIAMYERVIAKLSQMQAENVNK